MKKIMMFLLPAVLLCAGCIPLLIGGAAGALGGYAISSDTVQGETDKPLESVWAAAAEVGNSRGVIKEQDEIRGYMHVEIDSSKVWIRVIKLTQATTRLKISARKHHLPNLRLAQDLFVKIVEQER